METREERLFEALDTDGAGYIEAQSIIDVMHASGLAHDDPRLTDLFARLRDLNDKQTPIDLNHFH